MHRAHAAQPPSRAEAVALAGRIERSWWDRADRSYDPYDGLLGRFPPEPLRKQRFWRLVTVQLHKRSPVNLRPAFGVRPSRNSYGTGVFASAAIALERLRPDAARRARIARRLDWLREMRTGGGWAYPFHVETKTGSYPPTEPNVICTVFAGEAFLDAAEHFGDGEALEVARDAAAFVAHDLGVDRDGRRYFRYLRGYHPLIHNANVLAARFLVRCGRLGGDEDLVGAGFEALTPTLEAIRPDGSLVYGDDPSMQWVDGHHTGFVIDSLWQLARRGREDLEGPMRKMAAYYAASLFDRAWPKQSPESRYPVDTIAGAQGIQTLARLGGEHLEHARAIAGFMVSRMLTKRGTFLYMRKRSHAKRVPYARWCDAPMAYALAVLASELVDEDLD
ncbi:MAG: hypothetical protein M3134_09715 [Actinomycetota bacterium]|nr:hypothetical protein [Actinomycetota bacterium]